MRIAVIGAGISGLGCARLLQMQGHAVTLFEANDYLGGHTCTVDVTLEGQTAPVDTGFLVFNDRTYPLLIALFDELGVHSTASEMSFSVRADEQGIEWSGTDLAALFAQPRNALRPAFWRMLADILRFNRETTRLLADAGPAAAGAQALTVGQYLARERYSVPFREWYLIPMAAAIWSSPRLSVEDFPLLSFVRFCHNHGLLQIRDRPQWRTVTGGGRTYVARIAAQLADVRLATPVLSVRRRAAPSGGVELATARGSEAYDGVVLACHSDEALRVLADPSDSESQVLGAVRYQPNDVWLHTDDKLLPRARRAWSAWNYLSASDPDGQRPVAVSYLINKLQPLPFRTPVVVSLNPPFEPRADHVLRKMVTWHPLLDSPAVRAQAAVAGLQGQGNTWFAGAWLGYGFHEDGLRSAHAVAERIGGGTHA